MKIQHPGRTLVSVKNDLKNTKEHESELSIWNCSSYHQMFNNGQGFDEEEEMFLVKVSEEIIYK